MGKVKRYIFAALVGSVVTVSLVFFMIALIAFENDQEPTHNILTTQVKVSSPPGLAPSKKINSESKRKHNQLPAKRKVILPIDHKKLLSNIKAQEADGNQTDRFAAAANQQKLLELGSQSQAKVVLAGQFNVIGPDPQYPYDALVAGQEGWVEAMIKVKQDGSVDDIEIIGAGPAGIFEMAVVTAVFDWKVQYDRIDQAQAQNEYFHRFEFKIAD